MTTVSPGSTGAPSERTPSIRRARKGGGRSSLFGSRIARPRVVATQSLPSEARMAPGWVPPEHPSLRIPSASPKCSDENPRLWPSIVAETSARRARKTPWFDVMKSQPSSWRTLFTRPS